MPRNDDGTFHVLKCVTWAIEEARKNTTTAETAESQKWLTAFRRERALIQRIERKKLEASLVSRDEVIRSWVWRLVEVKNGLLLLKDRLSGLLEGKSRKEISHILGQEVYHMLNNYSRGGPFTPRTQEAEEIMQLPQQ